MSLLGLIPSEVSINAAIAICAVAFVSGTARGFSGFGSALIFMPLASSIADPRLVAALLLIIDFIAAAPLLPGAWQKADRKATSIMVFGALIGVPIGTYFPEPARTGDDALDHFRLRVRAAAAVAVGLALPRQGLRRGLGRYRRAGRLLQRARPDRRPADRRLLARPPATVRDRPRQHRAVLRRFGFLFRRQLCRGRTDHAGRDQVRGGGRPGLCASASGSALRCSARPAKPYSARSATR